VEEDVDLNREGKLVINKLKKLPFLTCPLQLFG